MSDSLVSRALAILREDGPKTLAVRIAGLGRSFLFGHVLPFRKADFDRDEIGLMGKVLVGYLLGIVLGERLSTRLSVWLLHRRRRREKAPLDSIQTAFDFVGVGKQHSIRPMQSRRELAAVVELVRANNPERILEVGTARGGTLYTWCREFDTLSTAVSVSLPADADPGPSVNPTFLTSFVDERMVCIRGDAHAQATRTAVTDHVESVDFVFIDADKSYTGVRRHFEMYEPLVSDGGVLAIHDTQYNEGVSRFWEEVSREYETTEIVHGAPRLGGEYVFGTGVVWL
ncbi:CmcI family methyltransferase [Halomicroarcula sp. GCM10025709]|uniref:class I SAM-dependent methyltransferase n=1 Tax=Haloarcula TaxID=2237 RepID=UPI0024C42766|nr:class I SAM-dependent methyltransferase [Halomicroarcula sp. YJ-61-S]